MIDRRNVLELIGKNSGKYHSCILTCYSLDFSFFEERVLPTLRAANVKNVNVFADGHFLELAQEMSTGKEFKQNKTYNFHPIYCKGVFHPKIMLLTGVKHGLLIIGSGNLTSSGLNTNDEIWGAFHLDNLENENASLFGQVWDYLKQFTEATLGFSSQKIDWITKYSPWLNELPKVDEEFTLNSINQTVQFVRNTSAHSIFTQLDRIIPKEGLIDMTIVSPYFDKNGTALKQLYETFKPKVFNCIVDQTSGLLPVNLDPEIESVISFYDWKDCKKDFLQTVNRLHAKVFYFKFENDDEFIMLGSANATMSALGGTNVTFANHEAGIIIKRNSKESWLKELSIELPSNTLNIKENTGNRNFDNQSVTRQNKDFRILYSELRGLELSVYLDKPYTEGITLTVNNRDDVELETLPGTVYENHIVFIVSHPEQTFKVFLTKSGSIISNHSLVHRFDALLRCNPDPTQEKLEALLDDEYPEGEGVTVLLQYIDYNWADEDIESTKRFSSASSSTQLITNSQPIEKEYDRLEASEFNNVSTEVLLKQSGELSSSNVKIAEFLNLITSGSINKNDDYTESEEQKLFEDQDQVGGGKEIQTASIIKTNGHKEKQAILNYFRKLDLIYTDQLSNFVKHKALTEAPNEKLTIRSLSNMLIALQLIQLYYGKKFISNFKDDNQSKIIEDSYILEGNIFSGNETVKGFLMNAFGKFLLLSCAGIKRYEFDVLNQKQEHSLSQIMIKSIFIILNLNWRESELNYRKSLLLNILFYMNSSKPFNESFVQELEDKLEIYRNNAKYISASFEGNRDQFIKDLLTKFINWHGHFENMESRKMHLISSTNTLDQGSFLFNSKIGFNEVGKIIIGNSNSLDLKRAGYFQFEGEYVLKNIAFGQNIVSFK
jgi:hypothetical protein